MLFIVIIIIYRTMMRRQQSVLRPGQTTVFWLTEIPPPACSMVGYISSPFSLLCISQDLKQYLFIIIIIIFYTYQSILSYCMFLISEQGINQVRTCSTQMHLTHGRPSSLPGTMRCHTTCMAMAPPTANLLDTTHR